MGRGREYVAGAGQGGGTGPGELVGGEVANANRGAVSGAQGGDGGGGGDGSGLASEGKGAASRMADAGNCGGDGGVVNVYELSHGPGEPDRTGGGRQGAARLLRLNHRTLAASAGDSGNAVMGVVAGDNVGNDNGSKVLGDVVVGAGGPVRRRNCA